MGTYKRADVDDEVFSRYNDYPISFTASLSAPLAIMTLRYLFCLNLVIYQRSLHCSAAIGFVTCQLFVLFYESVKGYIKNGDQYHL